METYGSSSDLAILLKLSSRRVGQLVKEGVLTKGANGKYNLPESIEAYYAFKFKSDEKLSYDIEHTLLERAKRETTEIELEQLKGSLLYANDVEHAMANMILTAKARLLSLPSKCAPKILGQKNITAIAEIIQREIYDALSELREMPAPRFENNVSDT